MKFINQKRLRDYPRLMLLASIMILVINLIFHRGWLGGFGQIIGTDFITLFSEGLIYNTSVDRLYDFRYQAEIQQQLITPSHLPSVNPFISPPYVAAVYSYFNLLDLKNAFILWTLCSILLTIFASAILYKQLSLDLSRKYLTIQQIVIIIVSFFPFIEGIQVGQNHTLTLLLVTLITICSLSKRWYLAGFSAGLLLYKPQFVLGFLIVWIFGRKFKAIISFTLVAIIWIGAFLLINGLSPFYDYLAINSILLKLPYDKGFPSYLLITPYGFFTSLLPESVWTIIYRASQVAILAASVLIAREAHLTRNLHGNRIIYLYCLAILFPLLVTPYALLHDLLILIPLFVILSKINRSHTLKLMVVGTYLGGLILPLVGYVPRIALPSLITMAVSIFVLKNLTVLKNPIPANDD